MDNRILLSGELSTYSFYVEILKQFLKIYNSNSEIIPVLDARNLNFIKPAAVPVLLSFGDYLRKLYKQPIELLISKGGSLQNFIIFSRFGLISEQLKIFDIKENDLGAWEYKELRDLHKVSYTNISYSDAEEITDLVKRRNYIYDCLLDREATTYDKVLKDTNRLPQNIINDTIKSIAEIETNAIMYSKSYSFTFLASDKFGTNISIADTGIGFKNSFESANRELKMVSKYKDKGPIFHNYLVIMSVLNYSCVKNIHDKREDLWTLRNTVVNNNGTIKIHYENTQVIFSCSRCKECTAFLGKEDISSCVDCLLKDYGNNSYSPIKIYNFGLQGVRIEIVINRG